MNNIKNSNNYQSKSVTPEVQAIGEMHFEGNIIPHAWYKNIKLENGKADLVSINILADIVYWYRPTYIMSEQTGQVVSVQRKFKADALQRNKIQLSEKFGLTDRQVKESLSRLEKKNLIKREFRTIKTEVGLCGNVMFIKINPQRIKEITYQNIVEEEDVISKQNDDESAPPYDDTSSYGFVSIKGVPYDIIKSKGATFKSHTYTESTTKNSKCLIPSKDGTRHKRARGALCVPSSSAMKIERQSKAPLDPGGDPPQTSDNICRVSTPLSKNSKKTSVPRIERLPNVHTSEVEHAKLVGTYGEDSVKKFYQHLHNWKESKLELDPKSLKKHTDFYRITTWVAELHDQQNNLSRPKKASDKQIISRKEAVSSFLRTPREGRQFILDRGHYVQIANDQLYYDNPKFDELFKHYLIKYDIL